MANTPDKSDANTLTAPNRANWDERVPIHLASELYDMTAHRAGCSRLPEFETKELGEIRGLDIFHPQCHFGLDSFSMAQMGAKSVLGLDFSEPAIDAAEALAIEFNLADRVRFVRSSIDDGINHVPESAFDLAYVTWGTIGWLPNLQIWANLISHALRPGGRLYFADAHPTMLIFDDQTPLPNGLPGFFVPYFLDGAYEFDDPTDYADPSAQLENSRTMEWMHTISDILAALNTAGLKLDFLHEHDCILWQAFSCLVQGEDRFYRWPDKPWLPLSLSLMATKS